MFSPSRLLTQTQGRMDGRIEGRFGCWLTQVCTWIGTCSQTCTLADIPCHTATQAPGCFCALISVKLCTVIPGDGGGGGGRGSRSVLSLGHCGHLSVPVKLLLPVPNPHGASFTCTFFSRRWPCLLNAHSWGGRCVQHELGWGRLLLDLGWAP